MNSSRSYFLFISAIITCLVASTVGFASQSIIIDFDYYPGPDRMLGTADDLPVNAPLIFDNQTIQLTDQYADLGILFTPDPPVNDKNEILDNSSFGAMLPEESAPNLLTTREAAGSTIEARFTVPVFEVGALIGLEAGTPGNTLSVYDAGGGLLGSVFGSNEFVSISSVVPIASFKVTDTVPAIDNLTFTIPEPTAISLLGIAAVAFFTTSGHQGIRVSGFRRHSRMR